MTGYHKNHWQLQAEREDERYRRQRARQTRTPAEAKLRRTEYVYAVEGAGLIKIGRSYSPDGRLRDLKIGSPVPLTILATIDGDSTLEAVLHRYLSQDWSHGEWFRPSVRTEVVISLMKERNHVKLGNL